MVCTAAGPFALVAAAFMLLLESPTVSAQADTAVVWILVVKEHGVGSPTMVQPYLDRFVAIAAEQNGWADAKGQYYNNRSAAEAFIQAHQPHYGIFSLPAFLALQAKYKLEVIGQVAVSLAGGRRYYLVSKSAADLAECERKTVASDHMDDTRFIERVVAGGRFTLADFTVVQTQRPLQTIKKVINGEAACALVDDAQLAELPHLEGADGLRTVWKSAELPPMVVTAFPTAPADERNRFQEDLAKLCDNEGQSACAEVGIVSLKAASATDYAAVVAAYGN
ncbi:MAG: PhnD/SsuA/transferrin family substrate-binding protein [Candidatus Binatia bacterium]